MEKVTVEQVVEITIQDLEKISVPISQYESIGAPIRQAVHNLRQIQAAWKRDEEEQRNKLADEEPVITFEPVMEQEEEHAD